MTVTGARRLADSITAGGRHRYGSTLPRVAGANVACVVGECAGWSGPKAAPAVYWDHCHTHGWIRGPVCAYCNCQMKVADAGVKWTEALSLHYQRCPGCSAQRPPIARWWLYELLHKSLSLRLRDSGYSPRCHDCDILHLADGNPVHEWSPKRIRIARNHLSGKSEPSNYTPWELREQQRGVLARGDRLFVTEEMYATPKEIQRLLARKSRVAFLWRKAANKGIELWIQGRDDAEMEAADFRPRRETRENAHE